MDPNFDKYPYVYIFTYICACVCLRLSLDVRVLEGWGLSLLKSYTTNDVPNPKP